MKNGMAKPAVEKYRSEDVINTQMLPGEPITHEQIVVEHDRPQKVTASTNPYIYPNTQNFQPNPYEQHNNPPHLINKKNMQQSYPQQLQQNPYEKHPPQVVQDGNVILIDGVPQQVVIVNQANHGRGEEVKRQQAPSWTRQARIGCCCVSVHNDSYCCNIFCMDSFCRCIQHSNLCCYCHNIDCVHCCVHSACRTCCFEKEFCECLLECCKHMPICILVDCLKNGACGECICNCIQNCHICEVLKNCDCECIQNIVGGICGIICCFFK